MEKRLSVQSTEYLQEIADYQKPEWVTLTIVPIPISALQFEDDQNSVIKGGLEVGETEAGQTRQLDVISTTTFEQLRTLISYVFESEVTTQYQFYVHPNKLMQTSEESQVVMSIASELLSSNLYHEIRIVYTPPPRKLKRKFDPEYKSVYAQESGESNDFTRKENLPVFASKCVVDYFNFVINVYVKKNGNMLMKISDISHENNINFSQPSDGAVELELDYDKISEITDMTHEMILILLSSKRDLKTIVEKIISRINIYIDNDNNDSITVNFARDVKARKNRFNRLLSSSVLPIIRKDSSIKPSSDGSFVNRPPGNRKSQTPNAIAHRDSRLQIFQNLDNTELFSALEDVDDTVVDDIDDGNNFIIEENNFRKLASKENNMVLDKTILFNFSEEEIQLFESLIEQSLSLLPKSIKRTTVIFSRIIFFNFIMANTSVCYNQYIYIIRRYIKNRLLPQLLCKDKLKESWNFNIVVCDKIWILLELSDWQGLMVDAFKALDYFSISQRKEISEKINIESIHGYQTFINASDTEKLPTTVEVILRCFHLLHNKPLIENGDSSTSLILYYGFHNPRILKKTIKRLMVNKDSTCLSLENGNEFDFLIKQESFQCEVCKDDDINFGITLFRKVINYLRVILERSFPSIAHTFNKSHHGSSKMALSRKIYRIFEENNIVLKSHSLEDNRSLYFNDVKEVMVRVLENFNRLTKDTEIFVNNYSDNWLNIDYNASQKASKDCISIVCFGWPPALSFSKQPQGNFSRPYVDRYLFEGESNLAFELCYARKMKERLHVSYDILGKPLLERSDIKVLFGLACEAWSNFDSVDQNCRVSLGIGIKFKDYILQIPYSWNLYSIIPYVDVSYIAVGYSVSTCGVIASISLRIFTNGREKVECIPKLQVNKNLQSLGESNINFLLPFIINGGLQFVCTFLGYKNNSKESNHHLSLTCNSFPEISASQSIYKVLTSLLTIVEYNVFDILSKNISIIPYLVFVLSRGLDLEPSEKILSTLLLVFKRSLYDEGRTFYSLESEYNIKEDLVAYFCKELPCENEVGPLGVVINIRKTFVSTLKEDQKFNVERTTAMYSDLILHLALNPLFFDKKIELLSAFAQTPLKLLGLQRVKYPHKHVLTLGFSDSVLQRKFKVLDILYQLLTDGPSYVNRYASNDTDTLGGSSCYMADFDCSFSFFKALENDPMFLENPNYCVDELVSYFKKVYIRFLGLLTHSSGADWVLESKCRFEFLLRELATKNSAIRSTKTIFQVARTISSLLVNIMKKKCDKEIKSILDIFFQYLKIIIQNVDDTSTLCIVRSLSTLTKFKEWRSYCIDFIAANFHQSNSYSSNSTSCVYNNEIESEELNNSFLKAILLEHMDTRKLCICENSSIPLSNSSKNGMVNSVAKTFLTETLKDFVSSRFFKAAAIGMNPFESYHLQCYLSEDWKRKISRTFQTWQYCSACSVDLSFLDILQVILHNFCNESTRKTLKGVSSLFLATEFDDYKCIMSLLDCLGIVVDNECILSILSEIHCLQYSLLLLNLINFDIKSEKKIKKLATCNDLSEKSSCILRKLCQFNERVLISVSWKANQKIWKPVNSLTVFNNWFEVVSTSFKPKNNAVMYKELSLLLTTFSTCPENAFNMEKFLNVIIRLLKSWNASGSPARFSNGMLEVFQNVLFRLPESYYNLLRFLDPIDIYSELEGCLKNCSLCTRIKANVCGILWIIARRNTGRNDIMKYRNCGSLVKRLANFVTNNNFNLSSHEVKENVDVAMLYENSVGAICSLSRNKLLTRLIFEDEVALSTLLTKARLFHDNCKNANFFDKLETTKCTYSEYMQYDTVNIDYKDHFWYATIPSRILQSNSIFSFSAINRFQAQVVRLHGSMLFQGGENYHIVSTFLLRDMFHFIETQIQDNSSYFVMDLVLVTIYLIARYCDSSTKNISNLASEKILETLEMLISQPANPHTQLNSIKALGSLAQHSVKAKRSVLNISEELYSLLNNGTRVLKVQVVVTLVSAARSDNIRFNNQCVPPAKSFFIGRDFLATIIQLLTLDKSEQLFEDESCWSPVLLDHDDEEFESLSKDKVSDLEDRQIRISHGIRFASHLLKIIVMEDIGMIAMEMKLMDVIVKILNCLKGLPSSFSAVKELQLELVYVLCRISRLSHPSKDVVITIFDLLSMEESFISYIKDLLGILNSPAVINMFDEILKSDVQINILLRLLSSSSTKDFGIIHEALRFIKSLYDYESGLPNNCRKVLTYIYNFTEIDENGLLTLWHCVFQSILRDPKKSIDIIIIGFPLLELFLKEKYSRVMLLVRLQAVNNLRAQKQAPLGLHGRSLLLLNYINIVLDFMDVCYFATGLLMELVQDVKLHNQRGPNQMLLNQILRKNQSINQSAPNHLSRIIRSYIYITREIKASRPQMTRNLLTMDNIRKKIVVVISSLTTAEEIRHKKEVLDLALEISQYPLDAEKDTTIQLNILKIYQNMWCNPVVFRRLRYGKTLFISEEKELSCFIFLGRGISNNQYQSRIYCANLLYQLFAKHSIKIMHLEDIQDEANSSSKKSRACEKKIKRAIWKNRNIVKSDYSICLKGLDTVVECIAASIWQSNYKKRSIGISLQELSRLQNLLNKGHIEVIENEIKVEHSYSNQLGLKLLTQLVDTVIICFFSYGLDVHYSSISCVEDQHVKDLIEKIDFHFNFNSYEFGQYEIDPVIKVLLRVLLWASNQCSKPVLTTRVLTTLIYVLRKTIAPVNMMNYYFGIFLTLLDISYEYLIQLFKLRLLGALCDFVENTNCMKISNDRYLIVCDFFLYMLKSFRFSKAIVCAIFESEKSDIKRFFMGLLKRITLGDEVNQNRMISKLIMKRQNAKNSTMMIDIYTKKQHFDVIEKAIGILDAITSVPSGSQQLCEIFDTCTSFISESNGFFALVSTILDLLRIDKLSDGSICKILSILLNVLKTFERRMVDLLCLRSNLLLILSFMYRPSFCIQAKVSTIFFRILRSPFSSKDIVCNTMLQEDMLLYQPKLHQGTKIDYNELSTKIDILKRCRIFAELTKSQLHKVATKLRVIKKCRNDKECELWNSKLPSLNGLLIILRGSVKFENLSTNISITCKEESCLGYTTLVCRMLSFPHGILDHCTATSIFNTEMEGYFFSSSLLTCASSLSSTIYEKVLRQLKHLSFSNRIHDSNQSPLSFNLLRTNGFVSYIERIFKLLSGKLFNPKNYVFGNISKCNSHKLLHYSFANPGYTTDMYKHLLMILSFLCDNRVEGLILIGGNSRNLVVLFNVLQVSYAEDVLLSTLEVLRNISGNPETNSTLATLNNPFRPLGVRLLLNLTSKFINYPKCLIVFLDTLWSLCKDNSPILKSFSNSMKTTEWLCLLRVFDPSSNCNSVDSCILVIKLLIICSQGVNACNSLIFCLKSEGHLLFSYLFSLVKCANYKDSNWINAIALLGHLSNYCVILKIIWDFFLKETNPCYILEVLINSQMIFKPESDGFMALIMFSLNIGSFGAASSEVWRQRLLDFLSSMNTLKNLFQLMKFKSPNQQVCLNVLYSALSRCESAILLPRDRYMEIVLILSDIIQNIDYQRRTISANIHVLLRSSTASSKGKLCIAIRTWNALMSDTRSNLMRTLVPSIIENLSRKLNCLLTSDSRYEEIGLWVEISDFLPNLLGICNDFCECEASNSLLYAIQGNINFSIEKRKGLSVWYEELEDTFLLGLLRLLNCFELCTRLSDFIPVLYSLLDSSSTRCNTVQYFAGGLLGKFSTNNSLLKRLGSPENVAKLFNAVVENTSIWRDSFILLIHKLSNDWKNVDILLYAGSDATKENINRCIRVLSFLFQHSKGIPQVQVTHVLWILIKTNKLAKKIFIEINIVGEKLLQELLNHTILWVELADEKEFRLFSVCALLAEVSEDRNDFHLFFKSSSIGKILYQRVLCICLEHIDSCSQFITASNDSTSDIHCTVFYQAVCFFNNVPYEVGDDIFPDDLYGVNEVAKIIEFITSTNKLLTGSYRQIFCVFLTKLLKHNRKRRVLLQREVLKKEINVVSTMSKIFQKKDFREVHAALLLLCSLCEKNPESCKIMCKHSSNELIVQISALLVGYSQHLENAKCNQEIISVYANVTASCEFIVTLYLNMTSLFNSRANGYNVSKIGKSICTAMSCLIVQLLDCVNAKTWCVEASKMMKSLLSTSTIILKRDAHLSAIFLCHKGIGIVNDLLHNCFKFSGAKNLFDIVVFCSRILNYMNYGHTSISKISHQSTLDECIGSFVGICEDRANTLLLREESLRCLANLIAIFKCQSVFTDNYPAFIKQVVFFIHENALSTRQILLVQVFLLELLNSNDCHLQQLYHHVDVSLTEAVLTRRSTILVNSVHLSCLIRLCITMIKKRIDLKQHFIRKRESLWSEIFLSFSSYKENKLLLFEVIKLISEVSSSEVIVADIILKQNPNLIYQLIHEIVEAHKFQSKSLDLVRAAAIEAILNLASVRRNQQHSIIFDCIDNAVLFHVLRIILPHINFHVLKLNEYKVSINLGFVAELLLAIGLDLLNNDIEDISFRLLTCFQKIISSKDLFPPALLVQAFINMFLFFQCCYLNCNREYCFKIDSKSLTTACQLSPTICNIAQESFQEMMQFLNNDISEECEIQSYFPNFFPSFHTSRVAIPLMKYIVSISTLSCLCRIPPLKQFVFTENIIKDCLLILRHFKQKDWIKWHSLEILSTYTEYFPQTIDFILLHGKVDHLASFLCHQNTFVRLECARLIWLLSRSKNIQLFLINSCSKVQHFLLKKEILSNEYFTHVEGNDLTTIESHDVLNSIILLLIDEFPSSEALLYGYGTLSSILSDLSQFRYVFDYMSSCIDLVQQISKQLMSNLQMSESVNTQMFRCIKKISKDEIGKKYLINSEGIFNILLKGIKIKAQSCLYATKTILNITCDNKLKFSDEENMNHSTLYNSSIFCEIDLIKKVVLSLFDLITNGIGDNKTNAKVAAVEHGRCQRVIEKSLTAAIISLRNIVTILKEKDQKSSSSIQLIPQILIISPKLIPFLFSIASVSSEIISRHDQLNALHIVNALCGYSDACWFFWNYPRIYNSSNQIGEVNLFDELVKKFKGSFSTYGDDLDFVSSEIKSIILSLTANLCENLEFAYNFYNLISVECDIVSYILTDNMDDLKYIWKIIYVTSYIAFSSRFVEKILVNISTACHRLPMALLSLDFHQITNPTIQIIVKSLCLLAWNTNRFKDTKAKDVGNITVLLYFKSFLVNVAKFSNCESVVLSVLEMSATLLPRSSVDFDSFCGILEIVNSFGSNVGLMNRSFDLIKFQTVIQKILDTLREIILSFYKFEDDKYRTRFNLNIDLDTYKTVKSGYVNVCKLPKWKYCFGVSKSDSTTFTQILHVIETFPCFLSTSEVLLLEKLKTAKWLIYMSTCENGKDIVVDAITVAFLFRLVHNAPSCTNHNIPLKFMYILALTKCACSRKLPKKFGPTGCIALLNEIARSCMDSVSQSNDTFENPLRQYVICVAHLSENIKFLQKFSLRQTKYEGDSNDTIANYPYCEMLQTLLYIVYHSPFHCSFSVLASKVLLRLLSTVNSQDFFEFIRKNEVSKAEWMSEEIISVAIIFSLYNTEFEFYMQNNVVVKVIHSSMQRLASIGCIDKGIPTFLRDNGLELVNNALFKFIEKFNYFHDSIMEIHRSIVHAKDVLQRKQHALHFIALMYDHLENLNNKHEEYCEEYEIVFKNFETRNGDQQFCAAMIGVSERIYFTQITHYAVSLIYESAVVCLGRNQGMHTDKFQEIRIFLWRIEKVIEWVIICLQNPEIDFLFYKGQIEKMKHQLDLLFHLHVPKRITNASRIYTNEIIQIRITSLEMKPIFWKWMGLKPYIVVTVLKEKYTIPFQRKNATVLNRLAAKRKEFYVPLNKSKCFTLNIQPEDVNDSIKFDLYYYVPYFFMDIHISSSVFSVFEQLNSHKVKGTQQTCNVQFFKQPKEKAILLEDKIFLGKLDITVLYTRKSTFNREIIPDSGEFFSTCGSRHIKIMGFHVLRNIVYLKNVMKKVMMKVLRCLTCTAMKRKRTTFQNVSIANQSKVNDILDVDIIMLSLFDILKLCTSKENLVGFYNKQNAAEECAKLMKLLVDSEDYGSFNSIRKHLLAIFSQENSKTWTDAWKCINLISDTYRPASTQKKIVSKKKSKLKINHRNPVAPILYLNEVSCGISTVSTLRSISQFNRKKTEKENVSLFAFPHVSILTLLDDYSPSWHCLKNMRAPDNINHFLVQPIERLQIYVILMKIIRPIYHQNNLGASELAIESQQVDSTLDCNTNFGSSAKLLQKIKRTSALSSNISLPLTKVTERASFKRIFVRIKETLHSLQKLMTCKSLQFQESASTTEVLELSRWEPLEAKRIKYLSVYASVDPLDDYSRLNRLNEDASNMFSFVYRDFVTAKWLHIIMWLIIILTGWRIAITIDAYKKASHTYPQLSKPIVVDSTASTPKKKKPGRFRQTTKAILPKIISERIKEGNRRALHSEIELKYFIVATEAKMVFSDLTRIWPKGNGNLGLGGFWSTIYYTGIAIFTPVILLLVLFPWIILQYRHYLAISTIAHSYAAFWLTLALISTINITRTIPAYTTTKLVESVNLKTFPSCLKNYLAIISISWEALQINSISFAAKVPWDKSYQVPKIMSLATLNLERLGLGPITITIFKAKQMFAFGSLVLWYFVLKASNKFKTVNSLNYLITFLLPNFLAGGLFMILSEQFFSSVACYSDYDKVEVNNQHLWSNWDVHCWENEHLKYAWSGLFGIGIYIPLAVLAYGTNQVVFPQLDLDLQMSPLVSMTSQIVKASIVAARTLYATSPRFFIGVSASGNLILLYQILMYPSSCSIWYLKYARVAIYIGSIWCSGCAYLTTELKTEEKHLPIYLLHSGLVVIAVLLGLSFKCTKRGKKSKIII